MVQTTPNQSQMLVVIYRRQPQLMLQVADDLGLLVVIWKGKRLLVMCRTELVVNSKSKPRKCQLERKTAWMFHKGLAEMRG